MQWGVFLPERSREIGDVYDFMVYLNSLAYRWFQGHWRYGKPKSSKRYADRMQLELDAYQRTGNCEHLRNIAVYTYLESQAPQNPMFHDDNTVDSVTRGRI